MTPKTPRFKTWEIAVITPTAVTEPMLQQQQLQLPVTTRSNHRDLAPRQAVRVACLTRVIFTAICERLTCGQSLFRAIKVSISKGRFREWQVGKEDSVAALSAIWFNTNSETTIFPAKNKLTGESRRSERVRYFMLHTERSSEAEDQRIKDISLKPLNPGTTRSDLCQKTWVFVSLIKNVFAMKNDEISPYP